MHEDSPSKVVALVDCDVSTAIKLIGSRPTLQTHVR